MKPNIYKQSLKKTVILFAQNCYLNRSKITGVYCWLVARSLCLSVRAVIDFDDITKMYSDFRLGIVAEHNCIQSLQSRRPEEKANSN